MEDGSRSSCEDTGPLVFTDFALGRRRAVVPTQGDHSYELFYKSADESTAKLSRSRALGGRYRPLFGSILTCLCNVRGGEADKNAHHPAAAQLLYHSPLQDTELLGAEEKRHLWEWQMEPQQALTSPEHDFLEKQSNVYSAEGGSVQYPHDLARRGESPPLELCQQLNDPEFISAALFLFESTLLRCRSEITIFCRVYMQQMVLSGYTLVKTIMDMEPDTMFFRKVHASYALESRICSIMFRCFESDSFDDSGLMRILDQDARAIARLQDFFRLKSLDPEEALAMHSPCYDAAFHQFCANKSEEIAAMFRWTLVYRKAGERDRFMEAFLRAAKWVWMLHRLANASASPMQILRVGRGMEIHPVYVEVVAVPPPSSCCPKCPVPKVEFMIVPGFLAPKTVFKAKVYQHYLCKPTSD